MINNMAKVKRVGLMVLIIKDNMKTGKNMVRVN
jgi:hypothetical protein